MITEHNHNPSEQDKTIGHSTDLFRQTEEQMLLSNQQ